MPTRSPLAVRLGNQEPQILHLPPDVASLAAAEDAIELADAYGIADGWPLAESQKITLRGALAERADGSWAATRIGDFGPRQGTGKNDKIAARELAGLILFGEQLIIHTAHEFPTANESFTRLVKVFENWDDLRKKVAHIYTANGNQSIQFLSGQRIIYKARTGGSGRGFAKADLVVYDEAQHLAAEHVAASGPAKLANPNSQTWYAGSGGLETSKKAWAIRREAILGTGGRLAYTEMTAETIRVADGKIKTAWSGDASDRDLWYRAMPGLGRWVTEEAVQAMLEDLGAEFFPREGLCIWDPEAGSEVESVIDGPAWAILGDLRSRRTGDVAFAVDVTPDHGWASIAVCGARGDGLPHVEVVDHRAGTEWVAGRCAELKAKHKPLGFWLDPSGPAGGLLPRLEQAGVVERPSGVKGGGFLEPVTGREHAQACAFLFEQVAERGFRHLGDPLLAAAVAGATKRPMGDAWAWSRSSSSVDISPLVAATLALWGFNSRRNVRPETGVVDLSEHLGDGWEDDDD